MKLSDGGANSTCRLYQCLRESELIGTETELVRGWAWAGSPKKVSDNILGQYSARLVGALISHPVFTKLFLHSHCPSRWAMD